MERPFWNPQDFLECFQVAPEICEDGSYFGYTIVRDGIALDITVYDWEKIVALLLKREKSGEVLINLILLVDTTIEYRREKWGELILIPACRVMPNFHYFHSLHGSDPGTIARLPTCSVQIVVDPDISVAFN